MREHQKRSENNRSNTVMQHRAGGSRPKPAVLHIGVELQQLHLDTSHVSQQCVCMLGTGRCLLLGNVTQKTSGTKDAQASRMNWHSREWRKRSETTMRRTQQISVKLAGILDRCFTVKWTSPKASLNSRSPTMGSAPWPN